MITTVHTVNAVTDKEKLEQVKNEMLSLGQPIIRAVNMGDYYQALEGSHRLKAAYELGITPIVEEIEYNEEYIEIQWDGYEDRIERIDKIVDAISNNETREVIMFDDIDIN